MYVDPDKNVVAVLDQNQMLDFFPLLFNNYAIFKFFVIRDVRVDGLT